MAFGVKHLYAVFLPLIWNQDTGGARGRAQHLYTPYSSSQGVYFSEVAFRIFLIHKPRS